MTARVTWDYRATVKVWTKDKVLVTSWTVVRGDAPGYGLADPLSIWWAQPATGQLWPQPGPMQASFRVVAAAMVELTNVLHVGHRVSILFEYAESPGVWRTGARFRGRIGAVSVDSHALGAIATVQCVDYTADLAEVDVGLSDWPAETAGDRILRVFAEAGIGVDVPGSPMGSPLRARPKGRVDARAALARILDTSTYSGGALNDPTVNERAYVVPRYAAVGDDFPDPAKPYRILNIETRWDPGNGIVPVDNLPGLLSVVSTGPTRYGLVIQPPTSSYGQPYRVIDAAHVDFGSSYALSKSGHPDSVTVNGVYTDGSTSVPVTSPGAVPIRLVMDTDLTDRAYANGLGMTQIMGTDSDQWIAQDFAWFADQAPWALDYPNAMLSDVTVPDVCRAACVIVGVDPTVTPNGSDYYAGQLRAAKLTLASGRFSVALGVDRMLSRPQQATGPGDIRAYLNPKDMASAGAPWSTLSPAQLDRSLSTFDVRLIKGVA